MLVIAFCKNTFYLIRLIQTNMLNVPFLQISFKLIESVKTTFM